MPPRMTCLALVLGALMAPPAAAFTAWNGNAVRESAPGQFEVRWRGGLSGAPEFWCAAGDFVVRGLGLSHATRIWRISPEPRRSGAPVRFSLSSEGAVDTGLVILWGDDSSLSASGAKALCER